MTRKSYQKYKDSGVEWLGKIPEHWEVLHLKRVTRFGYGDSLSEEDRIHGNIPVYGSNGVVGFHNYSNTKNPCLIIGRKGSFGKVAYTDQSCFAIDTTYYVDSTQTTQDIKWLYYCLQCLKLDAVSKDSAIPGLAREDAYNKFLPFCGSKEQKSIANFLDKETSQIDSLIQKKEKQIELLKEKRSALITQAVTKGLNLNVKMKNSGVKWLGKIPEHWKITKLKFLLSEPLKYGANESAEYDELSWPRYLRITDIDKNGQLKKETFKSIPKETAYPYLLKDGDILFARSGSIGRTFLYQKFYGQIAFAGYLIRARFEIDNIPKFIYYFCQSQVYYKWIKNNSIQATIQNISAEKYSNLFIPLPQIKEQKIIVDFLDKETSRIDSLIEKIKKSISLLKEYRSALITSAVTGKVDVCNFQVETEKIIPLKKSKPLKPIETKELELVAKAKKRYSKSIQEENPALIVKQASQKTENSLFKKTVLGAEIVAQLKDDPHFGRTKCMKTLYLCEAHLQIPLKGTYKRKAAGPLDNDIYRMEDIMKKNKWFEVVQRGSMYKYKALENSEGYKAYFDEYWGDYAEKLNQFLSLAKKFTTEQSEIVDTIYAVWNDFLIEGKTPSDNEIVNEAKNNWHKSKKRFSVEKLKKAIQWMKKQNLIPQGYGQKTKR